MTITETKPKKRGQGTVALEILNDLDDIDAIVVPIGGGGLIAGVAYTVKQIKPEVKVYGVQVSGAPSMYNSIKDGEIECLSSVSTIADGIADDMLTTTVMACPCKKIVAPAMNHNMYHNPIVQDNIKKLASYGYEIITPATGMLANGDLGDGRMPDEEELLWYIIKEIAFTKDLEGKKVLVTAGATREAIDPVRFITNHSSGKMGIAIARAAALRGADVTLVKAHTDIEAPMFVNVVPVSSAEDMFGAVTRLAPEQDIIIKAAAVSDYTPLVKAESKLKKSDGEMIIELTRTKDILKHLGENKKDGQFICGFSMETDNVIENSKAKLTKKNCDMICANSLRTEGAGFGVDTNVITLITKDGETELPMMSKDEAAHRILDEIIKV